MEGEADRRGNSCAPTAQLWVLKGCRGDAEEWGGGAAGKGKDIVVLKFPWDDPTPALSGKPEGHCCCSPCRAEAELFHLSSEEKGGVTDSQQGTSAI